MHASILAAHCSRARIMPFLAMACFGAVHALTAIDQSQRVLVHAVQCKAGNRGVVGP